MKRKILIVLTILNCISFLRVKSQSFITTWKTDNPGTSNSTSISIPTNGPGYNYDVDWDNDGVFDQFGITNTVTHDFGTAGIYTIRIQGAFPRIRFANLFDHLKLLSIDQWGNIAWSSFEDSFYGCENLKVLAPDAPNLSGVTSLYRAFTDIDSVGDEASTWNVSNITNMYSLFEGVTSFNVNIGGWNTSSVTDMGQVFFANSNFNQDISSWNTSNVTTFYQMFAGALSFNQDIGNWNTSTVTNMRGVFLNAPQFNQDISDWNTSNVTTMHQMFSVANAFNQDLRNWNTAKVEDMHKMFYGASNFNQNIGDWNIESISEYTFDSVIVGNTVYYTNENSMSSMLDFTNLSIDNYDSTIIGWLNTAPNDVRLGAEGLLFCNAQNQRQDLIDNFGWSFIGDSLDCSGTILTGLENTEHRKLNQLKIYPNPANNIITVSMSDKVLNQIHLYNILGNEVTSVLPVKNGNTWQVQISSLKAGLYIIEANGIKTRFLKVD